MFRRKDEEVETMETTTEATAATTTYAPQAPAAVAPIASATAPAAQQTTPAFRPVPPQAAMASNAPRGATSPSGMAERPSAPLSRTNAKRVLTVGPDIQMKGEITTCDRVVIEGMVDATMRDVHTVELAETGALKGIAEVEDAEISGNFEGDLTVRGKLTVYSSGRVRGNVTYGEIEIQRGGQISGNIRNVADAKQPANLNAPQQKKVA